MENENNKSTNNHFHKHIKKQYILKRYNDVDDLIKVKESFLDPNKYLKKQKKISVGIFPSKTTMGNSQTIEKNKFILPSQTLAVSPIHYKLKNEKKIKNNFGRKIKSKSFTMNAESVKNKKLIRNFSCLNRVNKHIKDKNYYNTYLNNLENTNEKHDRGIHYQIKSLKDILNIYREYKNLEEENKSKRKSIILGNDKLPNDIIKEIGKNLLEQENVLNNQQKLKNDSVLLSKTLSKKIKRKEKDLLYNKIEEYRFKKQLIELIEKSKSVRDKFGANYWVADLRRPKTHSDIRFVYSNTSNVISPDMMIDYADKDFEFVSDPSMQNSSRYFHLLKNLDVFKNVQKFNASNLEQMKGIEVIKGKNLLNQELNLVNNLKEKNIKQFKIYKDPIELKKKNVKELICKENYDKKYRIQRNRSYSNEENKNQNININTKRGLYRSKSTLGNFKVKEKANKVSYFAKALQLVQKEKKQKETNIKILSYK